MGTQSSSLQPPPVPLRTPFVDNLGVLTKEGWWFLYQLFRGAQQAEGTAILEALDSGTENALTPVIRDLSVETASSYLETETGVTQRQLDQATIQEYLCPWPGITLAQFEEVGKLLAMDDVGSIVQRLADLEKFVAIGFGDQPPGSNVAFVPYTNKAGSTGGVALTGQGNPGVTTPLPTGTPVDANLPSPGSSTVGQMVIFNGIPWIFTADPSGGGTGYWAQAVSSQTNLSGTHAARAGFAAASYAVGTVYYETDTNVSYMVQIPAGVKTWLYYNGIQVGTLAGLPGGLGVNDINYTYQATDYLHIWVWNGSGWHFSATDQGSGYTIVVTGGVLPYGLWGLFDGSTYAVSRDNGTTFNYVTTVISNTYIRR